MQRFLVFIAVSFLLVSCATTNYYVVRHGEKADPAAGMGSDVALSSLGTANAEELRDILLPHRVTQIYSTNYIRTKSTAQPLADAIKIPVVIYDPADKDFVSRLKMAEKENILIVGHSNTVDEIVNGLMGEAVISDLPDNEYGSLFVITKKGKKYTFEKRHFGKLGPKP